MVAPMEENLKHGILVSANEKYSFIESIKCPLGNDNCHFHGPDASYCTRGNANGVRLACVCKSGARIKDSDITIFANAIKDIAGGVVFERIMASLQRGAR